MATQAFDRGTAARWNAADVSWSFSPTGNFLWGAQAFLAIACDNSAAGGTDPITGVTDSLGNRWNLIRQIRNSPGNAPNDGVCVRMYACSQSVDIFTTGTVITVTFSVPTAAKAYTLIEFASTEPNRATIPGASTGGNNNTTTPNVTVSSPTIGVGQVVVCARQVNAAPLSQEPSPWSVGQVSFTNQTPSTSDMSIISQWLIFPDTLPKLYDLLYADVAVGVMGEMKFADPTATTLLSPATSALTLSGQNAEISTPGVPVLKAALAQQVTRTVKVTQ